MDRRPETFIVELWVSKKSFQIEPWFCKEICSYTLRMCDRFPILQLPMNPKLSSIPMSATVVSSPLRSATEPRDVLHIRQVLRTLLLHETFPSKVLGAWTERFKLPAFCWSIFTHRVSTDCEVVQRHVLFFHETLPHYLMLAYMYACSMHGCMGVVYAVCMFKVAEFKVAVHILFLLLCAMPGGPQWSGDSSGVHTCALRC